MSLKDKRRIYTRSHCFKQTEDTHQKSLRHSPTVRSVIRLKKRVPVNVACTKAFFLNVGMVVRTAVMIFLISSDVVKIHGKVSDKGAGMKEVVGGPLKIIRLDLNPGSAGICQSFSRICNISNPYLLICKMGPVISCLRVSLTNQ